MKPEGAIEWQGWKDGEVIDFDPFTGMRKVYRDIDEKHGMIMTEYVHAETLRDVNAEQRVETMNKRWGDGDFIARIPFNLLADKETGISKALRQRDHDYVRRWLSEYSALKTRDKL